MEKLVVLAKEKLGTPSEGRCYCLKLSPVLVGAYDAANLSEISLNELIAFSGELAEQIEDVPEGGQIKIKWLP